MNQKENTGRFGDLGIEEKILSILTQKGFKTPTPIQHKVIESALKGKDIVGIAQTGTGKTFAFGIPMIQSLIHSKAQGLILVPTRELAIQADASLSKIGAPMGLKTAVIIGGTSQYPQTKALRNNPDIIIATPGRLDDLMKQGICKLNKVKVVTLDEGDRMLDMGFLPQIKKILQSLPQPRQTMLFSATMAQSIAKLASEFMQEPLRVEIAPQGTSSENIEQELFIINKYDKMRLLDLILQENKKDKVLIFSRTKHGAKKIAQSIRNMGHTSTEIHSNRSQKQRQIALQGFTNGKFRIMVATDIAARGIDVKDISLVINYDLPDGTEDYVHRIGRTGRAGRTGKAVSFVNPNQRGDIKKIERLIRKSLKVVPLPELPKERERPANEEYIPNQNPWKNKNAGNGRQGGYGRRRNSNSGNKHNSSSNRRNRFNGNRRREKVVV